MNTVKVYYNSACPVCKVGVDGQSCRMAEQGVDDVEWIDVHANPAAAQDVGVDIETIREQLHVRHADGSVHVGADAFAVLFKKTSGQRWLGKLLSLPLLRSTWQVIYRLFARVLYRWNRAKGHW